MLKGNISSHLDTHNEDESSYVTLSNGPYGNLKLHFTHLFNQLYFIKFSNYFFFARTAYVVEPNSTDPDKYRHNLIDVYFITPVLCVQCEYFTVIVSYNFSAVKKKLTGLIFYFQVKITFGVLG